MKKFCFIVDGKCYKTGKEAEDAIFKSTGKVVHRWWVTYYPDEASCGAEVYYTSLEDAEKAIQDFLRDNPFGEWSREPEFYEDEDYDYESECCQNR